MTSALAHVRYEVVMHCAPPSFDCPHDGTCRGHVERLDVDEVATLAPDTFAALCSLDDERLLECDDETMRRVALAQAYADADRAWDLAREALIAARFLDGAVILSARTLTGVIALVREAVPEAGREAADRLAVARLLAVADVEGIEVGHG